MIMLCNCQLYDVKSIPSKKNPDRSFLNGKIRSNEYDFNYLTVGIRCGLDGVDLNKPHDLTLDVANSWFDNEQSGKKDCRIHISVLQINN